MPDEITRYAVPALIVLGSAILIALLPSIVWAVRFPFLVTNWLQWALSAPFRHILRNERADWPRVVHFLVAPLTIAYGLAAYVALAPLRLVNALYFNVFLYWSVALRDSLADVLKPVYSCSGGEYLVRWVFLLPFRLVRALARSPIAILQGIWTTLFDLVWPTLTLFHGTNDTAARRIATSGEWLAGGGDWVGTGVYFAISSEVASHYAGGSGAPYVLCRVTLTPARSVATLAGDIRRRVGHWQGDAISAAVGWPWASLEHWRSDSGGWYEFCLLQRTKYTPRKLWRVRPICVIRQSVPERIPSGVALWPNSVSGAVVLAATLAILLGVPYYHLGHPQVIPGVVNAAARTGQQLAMRVGVRSSAAGEVITVIPSRRPSTATPKKPAQTAPVPTSRRGASAVTSSAPAAARCPGSPASQLAAGRSARVADMAGDTLRVRSQPGLKAAVIAALSSGMRVRLDQGPVCADSLNWWRVSAQGVPTGWVAESFSGRTYLLPE